MVLLPPYRKKGNQSRCICIMPIQLQRSLLAGFTCAAFRGNRSLAVGKESHKNGRTPLSWSRQNFPRDSRALPQTNASKNRPNKAELYHQLAPRSRCNGDCACTRVCTFGGKIEIPNLKREKRVTLRKSFFFFRRMYTVYRGQLLRTIQRNTFRSG